MLYGGSFKLSKISFGISVASGQYQIGGGPFRTAPFQAPAPSLAHSSSSYQAPAYQTSVYETPAHQAHHGAHQANQAHQAPASSFQIPLHHSTGQPVAAAYNPATTNIALAPSACPAVSGLPISQCAGQVKNK